MDSSITSDQNFYSQSKLPQPLRDDHQENTDVLGASPYFNDEIDRTTQLAFSTSSPPATSITRLTSSAAASLVDSPDDFYKSFQGASHTNGGIAQDDTPSGVPASTHSNNPNPLLRSDNNGTTAKYPAIASSQTALRTSHRSVSAPINDGHARPTATLKGVPKDQQPSVRDLLKRFDPNGEQPSSLPRKTPARLQNNSPNVSNRYKSTEAIEKRQPSIKPGQTTRNQYMGPAKTLPTRSTQRNRFAVEDQRSNNALSSASRSVTPKHQLNGIGGTSRSGVNLGTSITAVNPIPTETSRKPLFGEIVPTESGSKIAYGISDPRNRARRTSDSSLLPQSWPHRRSFSDVDVSPSSPTAWYLRATPKLDDFNTDAIRSHNRSQSDVDGLATSSGLVDRPEGAIFKSDEKSDEKILPKPSSRSRLPISSKQASLSSASSSPTPHDASPFAAKMNASNKKDRKVDPRPWATPGHGSNGTRLSVRGQTRSPGKTAASNASLKAYISSPPPMKSPPLRSSRPRQPVSAATTASSRNKASDTSSRAHSNYINRTESGIQERARISRLASAGPVDYAAKRARIQQAFSKTIQETELKEIDQTHPEEATTQHEVDIQRHKAASQYTKHVKEPKLVVDTSFAAPAATLPKYQAYNQTLSSDSPTLGIPGSFPPQQVENDEALASAISNGTAVTLFDNELQTELAQHHSPVNLPSENLPTQQRSSQRDSAGSPDDFFDAYDGHESIQIVLDDASNKEAQTATFVDNQRKISNDERQVQYPTLTENSLRSSEQETESTSFIRTSLFQPTFDPQSIINDNHFEAVTTLPETNVSIHFNDDTTALDNTGAMPDGTGILEPPTSSSSHHGSPSRSSLTMLSKLDTSLYVSPAKSPTRPSDAEDTPVTEIDYESSGSMDELNRSYQHTNHRSGIQAPTWTDIYATSSNRSSSYTNTNTTLDLLQEPSAPPPPPPKEHILSTKPDTSPKSDNHTENFATRTNGDEFNGHPSEFYSSMTDLTEIDHTIKSSRSNSIIPPIPATPSWLIGSPSPPPVPRQTDTLSSAARRRTPPPSNVWNRHPPPSLHRYSFKDPESRRVSGDEMYSYRPSTSTARSSAQISLEGDAAETSLSSTDHLSIDVPQHSDDGTIPEEAVAALRHRKMLIQELIDTEAVYLKDMNVVVEIYQGTAEACPKLGNGDIKTIFRNSDEVISFAERFFADIKAASIPIYIPRSTKSKQAQAAKALESVDKGEGERPLSLADDETDWAKDRKTTIGENFGRHIKDMEQVYSIFLKNSEQATNRLQSLQADPTVNVWLEECNAVAKDLSGAWDLDALLVKPVQRITRYQLLLTGILKHTPQHHPDYAPLQKALRDIKLLLDNIDGEKRRIYKVNEIVGGRKRKESDLRSGIKNPFTRREKAETAVLHDRANEDQVYLKYCDKFHSEWIHLQFIIRDIDLYIEIVTRWVDNFLRYLSAIELVVRSSPSGYPELESKWARFNLSMRDVGKVALEEHKSALRRDVLEPFSNLTKAYIPPQSALKKRNKRRPDFQKFQYLKSQNRKIDEKLAEQVEQYTALNDTLKLELPKLSALNEKLKDMCLARLISIQVGWYSIWNEKLRTVLEQSELPKDVNDIVDKFNRDFKHQDARAQSMSILNGTTVASARGRLSHSTNRDDELSLKSKSRASTLNNRSRGLSTQSENQISLSPIDPSQKASGQSHVSSNAISTGLGVTIGGRPDARLSLESGGIPRPSAESASSSHRSLVEAAYSPAQWVDELPSEPSFSDVFNSALPWSNSNDDSQDGSVQRLSQARSDHQEILHTTYRVLYVVASLHEFNIEATKTEAGYPYLTYEDGEIFDVIAEKGELWLAKNQDDPTETVGWIWNQHFARMVEF